LKIDLNFFRDAVRRPTSVLVEQNGWLKITDIHVKKSDFEHEEVRPQGWF